MTIEKAIETEIKKLVAKGVSIHFYDCEESHLHHSRTYHAAGLQDVAIRIYTDSSDLDIIKQIAEAKRNLIELLNTIGKETEFNTSDLSLTYQHLYDKMNFSEDDIPWLDGRETQVGLIVAVGENGEIGKDNDLLWTKQKGDMAYFKEVTRQQMVAMGRNTWDSIPEKFRPLPGRINIVISGTLESKRDMIVVKSISEAIEAAKALNMPEIWFMGGKRVYSEALRVVDKALITRIHAEFPDADTYFEETLAMSELGFKMFSVPGKCTANEDNEYDYTFEAWVPAEEDAEVIDCDKCGYPHGDPGEPC